MKQIILTALIWLTASMSLTHAQSTKMKQLEGTVVDQTSGAPLEFATISLYSGDSLVDGMITDVKGRFNLKAAAGEYALKIQFISFESHEQNIKLTENLKLGQIKLNPSSELLKEAEVVGEKNEVEYHLDKKVYNPDKDITAEGGSANDVLNNVPSVSVTPDGQISLRGNSSVAILINGKPSVLSGANGLDQIPAEHIERIEVITNPSARYQSAGTAGIINVILKKSVGEGFNGSVRLQTGLPADHRASLSLNYNTDKVRLFSNVGALRARYYGDEKVSQSMTNQGVTTSLEQINEETSDDYSINFYVGGEYDLNEQNTLTAIYYHRNRYNEDATTLSYFYSFDNDSADNTILRAADYYEPQIYNQIETSYLKTFAKEGQRLTVDVQYDFWDDDENDLLSNLNESGSIPTGEYLRSRDIESSKDLAIQSDLIIPFGNGYELETGFRWETRVITSQYKAEIQIDDTWEVFQGMNNDVNYGEQIGGVYAQLGKSTKKLSWLLGLRSENTFIDISDVSGEFNATKEYLRFFPTAHISYKFSQFSSMQFGYSKRINRPGFWQLNPFGGFTDLNIRFNGNPDLDPSYTNSFELSYLKRWKKLSINPSLYYQYTEDNFHFFVEENPFGGLLYKPVNLDAEHRMGAELSVQYRIFKWWNMSGEANIFAFDQRGSYDDQNLDNSDYMWYSRLSSNFNLPAKLRLQIRANYRGARSNAQSTIKAQYDGDIALSKTIFKGAGSLSVRLRNVLDSRIQISTTTGQNFVSTSEETFYGRRLGFTFTYRFNQKENQRDRRPGRSNR